MQLQNIEDKIARFLEKKFRASRSLSTKYTYNSALNRFQEFLNIGYNLDIIQLLRKIHEKDLDPIEVLDDFYSFLSQYRRENSNKIGYSNNTISDYIVVAKEFLNGEGCKLYNEDIKQRFRLPRKINVYEKGLTKDIINRIIRLANPKLAAAILVHTFWANNMKIRLSYLYYFSDKV